MHHNGKGRKLGSGEIRRHREGRERNRKVEKKRQKGGQTKITGSRARQLKIAIFFYSLARGSRPAYCARENSWSRTRKVGSSCLVFRRSAISSFQPCYV